MKARLRKILISLLSVMLLTGLLTASVFATSGDKTYEPEAEDEGIKVTLTTDKEAYESGESARIILQIENNSGKTIATGNVTWAFNPKAAFADDSNGIRLGSAVNSIANGGSGTVAGSKILSLDGIDTSGMEQSDIKNEAGGLSVAGVVIVIIVVAVIAVIAIVVIIVVVSKKKGKKPPVSMLFLALLIAGAAAVVTIEPKQVKASDEGPRIVVQKTISCDGYELTIRAAVQFTYGHKVQAITGTDKTNYSTVSVHDPSIIKTDDKYYLIGSHLGFASSKDLKNWTIEGISFVNGDGSISTYKEFSGTKCANVFNINAYTGNVQVSRNGVITEVPFKNSSESGLFDGEAWCESLGLPVETSTWIDGDLWAPDVIYNETMGKYCMYMSLNGNDWHSAIVLLTSDDIEGPYEYQGPVVFSGFVADSSKAYYYKNSDLEIVLGELDSLPAKYNHPTNWGDYLPHCIDPCVSYDDDGNLWLIYGSWSGGIYALELDENTGLRDYTVEYPNDGAGSQGVKSDEYFGTKIAGGFYVSGEGPYVEKIGDYYWLFVSYGFYDPGTGYNMRVYRSENIDGPYVDLKGNSAIVSSWELTHSSSRGIRLFGGYRWPYMLKGSTAQGHNSAYYDEELDKAFLIFHRKFDDGTAGHQVEVHQLFLNKEGWLLAAPFSYNDETISETGYEVSEIVGDYDVIIHTKEQYTQAQYDAKTAYDIHYADAITLNEDGTVSGDYEGTWTSEDGSYYMTITIDGQEYSGVFAPGYLEGSNIEVMTFTALGTTNQITIWGSQVYEP